MFDRQQWLNNLGYGSKWNETECINGPWEHLKGVSNEI